MKVKGISLNVSCHPGADCIPGLPNSFTTEWTCLDLFIPETFLWNLGKFHSLLRTSNAQMHSYIRVLEFCGVLNWKEPFPRTQNIWETLQHLYVFYSYLFQFLSHKTPDVFVPPFFLLFSAIDFLWTYIHVIMQISAPHGQSLQSHHLGSVDPVSTCATAFSQLVSGVNTHDTPCKVLLFPLQKWYTPEI